jgi:predicted 3-demethylubiquinone-9 3-methyltransferase (glyoxalase superfamily)
MAKIEQRITPMLWFDNQAEEAANYYVSIFKNSKVTNVSRYGDTGPGPKGSVMVAEFELDGQKFTALNGGPRFKFTEAISLVVNCENQDEVDYYWEKTERRRRPGSCLWLVERQVWFVMASRAGQSVRTAERPLRHPTA